MFTNSNFPQTDLQKAYQFNTFSQYINNNGLLSKFSPSCIFCPSNDTIILLNDGSFRQCNKCKKQFKSKIIINEPTIYHK
jgi:predicted lactoylglutathione lyase